jgi:hypothetical protein
MVKLPLGLLSHRLPGRNCFRLEGGSPFVALSDMLLLFAGDDGIVRA